MSKKRKYWNTRKNKRQEKESNPLVCLLRILAHYFPNLKDWIDDFNDPRNPAYITYSQSQLIFVALLKNICSIESMRSMGESFNNETCIQNLSKITDSQNLSEIPHYDTVNHYLEKLLPTELSAVRTEMIRILIRSKSFDANRLFGKYWRIIIDGTGLFYFKEKHCDNCLLETRKNEEGKTQVRYYHKVLEAKLVLADNIVISLDSEFIENENENVTKQDCEINAAKRLLGRLKKDFPRLRICIQGDALYAAESIMEICADNGWSYIFTQKNARQPLIDEAYSDLEETDKTKVTGIGPEKGTGYFYNGVEKLAGKKQKANVFEYVYQKDNQSKHLIWLTNINITKTRLEQAIAAARGRWKIENEGFNTQKNILYHIQHLNSRNGIAMKNHYLLTQIADIVMQLYLAWGSAHKAVRDSLKNTALWLLESFRNQLVTDDDIVWINTHTSIYLQ